MVLLPYCCCRRCHSLLPTSLLQSLHHVTTAGVRNDIRALLQLSHPNLLRLHGMVVDMADGVGLLMEYAHRTKVGSTLSYPRWSRCALCLVPSEPRRDELRVPGTHHAQTCPRSIQVRTARQPPSAARL